MDLALNNLQRLICHKTQQTKPNESITLTDPETCFGRECATHTACLGQELQGEQYHSVSLQLKFSFSKFGCHIKVKMPSLPYYFTCRWMENI